MRKNFPPEAQVPLASREMNAVFHQRDALMGDRAYQKAAKSPR
jgi:hypothetical protein